MKTRYIALFLLLICALTLVSCSDTRATFDGFVVYDDTVPDIDNLFDNEIPSDNDGTVASQNSSIYSDEGTKDNLKPIPDIVPSAENESTVSSLPESESSGDEQLSVNTVWISKSGSKYHIKPTCSNMKNATEVSLLTATDKGLEPCKKCFNSK